MLLSATDKRRHARLSALTTTRGGLVAGSKYRRTALPQRAELGKDFRTTVRLRRVKSAQDSKRPIASFGEYTSAWLEQRPITSRTREHYRRLLQARLLPSFADTGLRDISPAAVRAWHGTTASGAPTMRTQAYSLLRSIMQTAVTDGLIDSNPCQITGVSTSGGVHKVRPSTQGEIETIAMAMPEAYRTLVLMAAWLVMRFGELSELRRKDVDLADKVVRVRRAVVHVDDDVEIATPKSAAGIRDIVIPPHLLATIDAHLRKHVQPEHESLLFPSVSDPNRHLAPPALYRMFYKAREAAGRPDLRAHDLRAFCGRPT